MEVSHAHISILGPRARKNRTRLEDGRELRRGPAEGQEAEGHWGSSRATNAGHEGVPLTGKKQLQRLQLKRSQENYFLVQPSSAGYCQDSERGRKMESVETHRRKKGEGLGER